MFQKDEHSWKLDTLLSIFYVKGKGVRNEGTVESSKSGVKIDFSTNMEDFPIWSPQLRNLVIGEYISFEMNGIKFGQAILLPTS